MRMMPQIKLIVAVDFVNGVDKQKKILAFVISRHTKLWLLLKAGNGTLEHFALTALNVDI